MKISISIGGSALEGDFDQQVQYVREAEKLGVESVWSVEGWGSDAITPLAYLAAKTERIRLGTAIMQASARVPAMPAMTALTLAAVSLAISSSFLGVGILCQKAGFLRFIPSNIPSEHFLYESF